MNKQEILLVGGGGHCKSCIDVIEQEGKYKIKGIIDLPSELGKSVLDYKVIGNDDEIISFIEKGYSFLITVGHLGDPKLRVKLFNLVIEKGGNLPIIISPNAYVSKHSIIEKGSIIMHDVLVNAGARIGENCIINTKALIEHDVNVKNHTHISTAVVINGEVELGENCFVGSRSVLRNNIRVSDDVIIGAGSVVVKDIKTEGTYIGNPAKNKE